ncbi:hypothetical protein AN639_06755 [Candidatus Epulonipiscium fishelsonii]|uniref:Uncharacterized protein n=1 Tax=Candidatus Epulonipiscium fishelsonii TaxID=77094 RepID=A0ACC8X800_9FIRM|nr:hypothetical protein AN396_12230 [Epulopiscium sp. SCG-B11WGA-EpuloA1]ONI39029.1 hypothetical protein AN639_06755 [Epulopiscium sp. SCG-B05WGA-EpuloA1]
MKEDYKGGKCLNKFKRIIGDKISKYTPMLYTHLSFWLKTGYFLNLKHPKSLSEKITYINLYKQSPYATICADKYEVRNYLKKWGYDKYLVDLIGVWDNADDIDLNKLPDKFVLKCNHGCGYNIICTDKSTLDIKSTKIQLNKWLKENYGEQHRELHYANIKPRIICEKYIEGLSDDQLPIDYKIHCSRGKFLFLLCVKREEPIKWEILNSDFISIPSALREKEHKFNALTPKNYKKMLEIAKVISTDFDIIRVDFYEVDGQMILGELTITPAGGRFWYITKAFDFYMGNKVKL